MKSFFLLGDEMTEWVAWNKVKKKAAGSRFRWTTERFCGDLSLPFISISPVNLSPKPLKNTRKSCPKPIGSDLLVQLPPFTGSIKSRVSANFFSRYKGCNDEAAISENTNYSELVPNANVCGQIGKRSKKTTRRLVDRLREERAGNDGVLGRRMLFDNNIRTKSLDSSIQ